MGQVPSFGTSAGGDALHDELREDLLRSLTIWRQHILHAFDNLPDADLRRPVLPSGWSYVGLVQHLTWDVERFWFQAVQAGEPMDLDAVENAWIVPDKMSTAEAIAGYEAAIERNDAIVRSMSLDADPLWWPVEIFPDMPSRPLHRTILHVLTETASHAGHLDIARELIDGRQWLSSPNRTGVHHRDNTTQGSLPGQSLRRRPGIGQAVLCRYPWARIRVWR